MTVVTAVTVDGIEYRNAYFNERACVSTLYTSSDRAMVLNLSTG